MRTVILALLLVTVPVSVAAQSSPGRGTGRSDESRWEGIDPNGGRLFFAPTARIVWERRGGVTLYELMLPTLSLTLSDNLLLTAGAMLERDLDGNRPLMLFGKLRLPTHRAFEAAVAGMTVFGGVEIWGMVYGVVTVGNDDLSVTGGAGYAYVESTLGSQTLTSDGPALFVGGDLRLGPDIKLVTENHFLPDSDPAVSLGVRFIGDRLSVDLGVGAVRPTSDPGLFPIIIIGYNW